MPTVEAIRKVTIQASTPGVDQSTGALNNLSAAQNRVRALCQSAADFYGRRRRS